MKERTLWERLFWSPNYFTIAIRKKTTAEQPVWIRGTLQADYVMSASREHWLADPILADDEGKTYLFFEAVHHGKGRIEVTELDKDGIPSPPAIAVERDYHLSYPFVFRHNGEWYMIPESCAIHEVQLLKAVRFPYEWRYVTTLLHAHAVDTTVHRIGEKLLMLTFLPQSGSERVTPRAFWVHWEEDRTIQLEELSWPTFDSLLVRGAGKIIGAESADIRPSQINGETNYGDGVLFSKIQVSDSAYREEPIGKVEAGSLNILGLKADGLHTYAVSEQFEVIDVRCQLPDPLKIFRRILGR